jgi:hypothetical protein
MLFMFTLHCLLDVLDVDVGHLWSFIESVMGHVAEPAAIWDRQDSNNKRPSDPAILSTSMDNSLPLHSTGIHSFRLPSPEFLMRVKLPIRQRQFQRPHLLTFIETRCNVARSSSKPRIRAPSGVCATRQIEEAAPSNLCVLETTACPDSAEDGLTADEVGLEHVGLERRERLLETLDGLIYR